MEIHTLAAGDLDPRTPGSELLVFTRPGGLSRCTPTGRDGGWETVKLDDLDGRVRDAIELSAEDGHPREIACVSRAGWLRLLRITAHGVEWGTVHQEPMGLGRVALRPGAADALVLYTTHDDGRILRHERRADPTWSTSVVYRGRQGRRGVVAGRFAAPGVETIAVFGYSGAIELLSRGECGEWTAKTIFRDRHKGHWLAAAELDGRNATDEILTSGYGARIVLLARPPGYGAVPPASVETR